jgi:hypothetical protein
MGFVTVRGIVVDRVARVRHRRQRQVFSR